MKGPIAGCIIACGILSAGCGSSTSGVEDDTPAPPLDGGGSVDGAGADGTVLGTADAPPGTDVTVTSTDAPSTSDVAATTDGPASTTDGPATTDGPPPAGSMPALSVSGNLIKDSTGKTVVLRGVAIPDIGSLDVAAGGATGVSARIDEILGAAMLDVDVIRMPVYPETCFNGGQPYYSPEPFPVGTPAAATAMPVPKVLSATDYINNVLKPAVTYAESKGLYVIIDYHQIDNVTGADNSGADAVTFWTQMAPVFASDPNVIYEAFNEPIDTTDGVTAGNWSTTFTTMAQSWVTAIRAGAPNTLIIMGSPSWSQYPTGSSGLTNAGNIVFTAHLYPGNWPGTAPMGGGATFQSRIDTAAMTVPIFMTEWGFQTTGSTKSNLYTADDTWGTSLKTDATMTGASWTAWVADPSWGPPMFGNATATTLTDFGTFVQTWLKSP